MNLLSQMHNSPRKIIFLSAALFLISCYFSLHGVTSGEYEYRKEVSISGVEIDRSMLAEMEVDIFNHYGTCIEKKMEIRSDGASINIKVKVKNKDGCLNEMGSYFDEEHSKARAARAEDFFRSANAFIQSIESEACYNDQLLFKGGTAVNVDDLIDTRKVAYSEKTSKNDDAYRAELCEAVFPRLIKGANGVVMNRHAAEAVSERLLKEIGVKFAMANAKLLRSTIRKIPVPVPFFNFVGTILFLSSFLVLVVFRPWKQH